MAINIGNIATTAVSGVASKLLGTSTGTSVSSAAQKLFSSNLINNLVSINSGGNDYVQFPDDLLSRSDVTQYTYFTCYTDSVENWQGIKKRTYLGSIYLPLPRDLSSGYKSSWSSAEGGIFAKAGESLANLGSAIYAGTDIPGSAWEGLKGTGGYAAMKASLEAAETIGAKAAIENATQRTLNPMNLLNWKSPDFRSFSFTWELVPSSGKEAEILNQVLYWLKRYIHTPSDPSDITLKFPPLWDIIFVDSQGLNGNAGNKFLFRAKQCAITDINVEYNTKGNAYHRVGEDGQGYQAPNGIKLSISFTETTILTQKDFGDSYSDNSTP